MTGCLSCEPAPIANPSSCWLYLWPTTSQTYQKLFAVLAVLVPEPYISGADHLRVTVAGAELERVLATMVRQLLPEECVTTTCLVMKAGTEPGFADFRRVQPIDRMVAVQGAAWLSDLIAAGRLETHFQPIVDAADPGTVFAHECLLRGRSAAGELISPGAMFGAAKQAGMLFQLDLAARRKAVQSIAHHKIDSYAFINFTPTSIYDPETCLRSTVAAVEQLGLDPARIVFEIIETEQAEETLLRGILQVYRSAGFKVAIDDYGAGFSSMNLINVLRPDFLKLDMALIRGVDHDPYKAELAAGLLQTAPSLGIRTIAEGVETEAEWDWVRAHGADLVQGYYVARPGNPPPTTRFSAV